MLRFLLRSTRLKSGQESIKSLREMEREYILYALQVFHGNRTKAARALGISLRGLRIKLREFRKDGLEIPRVKGCQPGEQAVPKRKPTLKIVEDKEPE